MLQTCNIFPGRPVMGAWITYALGSENQNLPAYVVLRDPEGYSTSGKLVWSSGFLPALYQGVEFSSTGTPVHHLSPVDPRPPGVQRESLDFLSKLNAEHSAQTIRESLSWKRASRTTRWPPGCSWQPRRCWTSRKSRRPPARLTASTMTSPQATNPLLMARRLVEAGVRFVQIFPGPGTDLGPPR